MAPAIVTARPRLVNPLLDCELAMPSSLRTHAELQAELQRIVTRVEEDGIATQVSIYFRALNDGPWIAIDANEQFTPASLMKVPLMVAVLRRADAEPEFLKRKVRYDSVIGTEVTTTVSDSAIDVGSSYTVADLMDRMIRFSDNEASFLLLREVTPVFAGDVMREIGIGANDASMSGDFTTVREYASVFRLLYNATYLDREESRAALELLTRTRYSKGLRARLPREVVVASKFGERTIPGSSLRQLHECGIVYHAASPYVLCIMTRGRAIPALEAVIAEVSATAYNKVAKAQR
jgi:beta-lactamase class A